MSKQLISAFPKEHWLPKEKDSLNVSEFFYDTIQGEGIYAGHPAVFLRLQGCTLNCKWCDTAEVWRDGNPYTYGELCKMISDSGLYKKLKTGTHLVITGGSPLKQQLELIDFLNHFYDLFGFSPSIEIENECVIKPHKDLLMYFPIWNNSPKLSNSGNSYVARYKPDVIAFMATLPISWFKFVVSSEKDWEEIEKDFLSPELIEKNQIILMPCGETRLQLNESRPIAIEMAIKHNVKYSDRLHIVAWDKKTGV